MATSVAEVNAADYVIVGAGSAGCVLANRLSADPAVKVVVLEAGGDDRILANLRTAYTNLMVRIPAGYSRVMNHPSLNWGYVSEPDPYAKNRVFQLARGRVLGGSSSINGMIYIRGIPEDYEGWRQLGCAGWAWSDVLPFFRRAERQGRGEDEWHGASGPLAVSDPPFRHPTSELIRAAFVQAGVPATDDLNGATPEGVTYLQATLNRGLRHSGAAAYLHPVRNRPNLKILTNVVAQRIRIEDGEARGVEVVQGGRSHFIRARASVILCGGTYNTPQLLQLSGVGDPDLLRTRGIPVVHASPQVGENMQDHYIVQIKATFRPGTLSLNARSRGLGLAASVLQYGLFRNGLLAGPAAQLTAFAKSRPELDLPDFQFFASPATTDPARTAAAGHTVLEQKPGVTVGGHPLRPRSLGHVRIRSADPLEHPAITTNFLSDPADHDTTVAGLRLAQRILQQPAIAPLLDGPTRPDFTSMSDAEVLDFARGNGFSIYHPVGTCRMGGDDAVVTPRLSVRGVGRLRVVDASVMPRIVSGNTNAAVVMIAEKACDMIREDDRVLA